MRLTFFLVACLAAGSACGGDSSAGEDAGIVDASIPTDDARVAMAVAVTVPDDGDQDVPVDTPIRIYFTQAVEASTLSVQAAWGPCDASATVQISSDGFSTCIGGTLSVPEAAMAEVAPHSSVLAAPSTYKIRVAATVTDTTSEALAAEYVQATGFATAKPPCTAQVDPTDVDTTGAVCIDPLFRDNGDGTVTDTANKLLWTKCTVFGETAVPMDGDSFGCVLPDGFEDWTQWERAIQVCDDLEYAGRSDWSVPDIARLETLVTETGDPAIDSTVFPNTSNYVFHSKSTYVDRLQDRWGIIFGYNDLRGPRNNPKLAGLSGALLRCVAGATPPAAPQFTDLRVWYAQPDRIAVFIPSYVDATLPAPTKLAYIGVDGTISVSGTTVTNALIGPIDLGALGPPVPYTYLFEGLSAVTDYRVVIVAESALGSSVAEVVTSTAAIAPQLALLQVSSYTDTTIDLAQPSFNVAGNPAPTVEAYLGADGSITANGPIVSGYDVGPIDVSAAGHTFHTLAPNITYRIFVVAENTAGYSVLQTSQHIGRYVDNLNGTVFSPSRNLTWQKCTRGMTFNPGSNNCEGEAYLVDFCHEIDNDCNGGIDNGLLGPPWLDYSPYVSFYSGAYQTCDDPFAGRSDWRVPTLAELEYLVDTSAGGAKIDASAFPETPHTRFWTANSSNNQYAWAVNFDTGDSMEYTEKTDEYAVRCVRAGP